jgi:hypothetical protein
MSWITIDEYGTSASGKTKRWVVRSTEGAREELGTISWYPFWRKYAFFPQPLTTYEESCLRDIATFCEDETKKQKAHYGIRGGSTA